MGQFEVSRVVSSHRYSLGTLSSVSSPASHWSLATAPAGCKGCLSRKDAGLRVDKQLIKWWALESSSPSLTPIWWKSPYIPYERTALNSVPGFYRKVCLLHSCFHSWLTCIFRLSPEAHSLIFPSVFKRIFKSCQLLVLKPFQTYKMLQI